MFFFFVISDFFRDMLLYMSLSFVFLYVKLKFYVKNFSGRFYQLFYLSVTDNRMVMLFIMAFNSAIICTYMRTYLVNGHVCDHLRHAQRAILLVSLDLSVIVWKLPLFDYGTMSKNVRLDAMLMTTTIAHINEPTSNMHGQDKISSF